MRQERLLLKTNKSNNLSVFVTIWLILTMAWMAVLCQPVKADTSINNKSWMKEISDEKNLSQIMLPGAHNAAASYLPLSLFSKCQKLSISELLDAGYRYLDIRVGVDEKSEEKILYTYHNFVPCYNKSGIIPRRLTFNDVIESCYEFLDDNPSETIILVIKYEHGDLSISEFENLIADAISNSIDDEKEKWLLTDETPCLKDARGKIVLYRRYEDEALLGKRSGIECIWSTQNEKSLTDCSNLLTPQNGEGLIVQDRYKLVPDDKWKAVEYVLGNCSEEISGYSGDEHNNAGSPVINFLSTAGNKSVGIPIAYARDLNKRFLDYDFDENMRPQWIIVDFGDEKISDKIIRANFE